MSQAEAATPTTRRRKRRTSSNNSLQQQQDGKDGRLVKIARIPDNTTCPPDGDGNNDVSLALATADDCDEHYNCCIALEKEEFGPSRAGLFWSRLRSRWNTRRAPFAPSTSANRTRTMWFGSPPSNDDCPITQFPLSESEAVFCAVDDFNICHGFDAKQLALNCIDGNFRHPLTRKPWNILDLVRLSALVHALPDMESLPHLLARQCHPAWKRHDRVAQVFEMDAQAHGDAIDEEFGEVFDDDDPSKLLNLDTTELLGICLRLTEIFENVIKYDGECARRQFTNVQDRVVRWLNFHKDLDTDAAYLVTSTLEKIKSDWMNKGEPASGHPPVQPVVPHWSMGQAAKEPLSSARLSEFEGWTRPPPPPVVTRRRRRRRRNAQQQVAPQQPRSNASPSTIEEASSQIRAAFQQQQPPRHGVIMIARNQPQPHSNPYLAGGASSSSVLFGQSSFSSLLHPAPPPPRPSMSERIFMIPLPQAQSAAASPRFFTAAASGGNNIVASSRSGSEGWGAQAFRHFADSFLASDDDASGDGTSGGDASGDVRSISNAQHVAALHGTEAFDDDGQNDDEPDEEGSQQQQRDSDDDVVMELNDDGHIRLNFDIDAINSQIRLAVARAANDAPRN